MNSLRQRGMIAVFLCVVTANSVETASTKRRTLRIGANRMQVHSSQIALRPSHC